MLPLHNDFSPLRQSLCPYLGDVVEHEPNECGGPHPRRLFLPMGVVQGYQDPAISVSKVASNKSVQAGGPFW